MGMAQSLEDLNAGLQVPLFPRLGVNGLAIQKAFS